MSEKHQYLQGVALVEYKKGPTVNEPDVPNVSHLNSKKGGDDYYSRTHPEVFENLEAEAAKSTAEKLFRDNFNPLLGNRTMTFWWLKIFSSNNIIVLTISLSP